MQHLRIVGVNEGENDPQLILSDDSGHEFALPVDEALRQAAARPTVRPHRTGPSTQPLSPREIQARLRSGATVDQVVAASGLSTSHVERYAGPVQAERAYMAQRAQTTQIAPASAAEAHRVAFGDAPATLAAMVKVRLRAMDVDLSTVSWDAWRREDGLWQITCEFDVDSSTTHGPGIGLKPPAEWVFQAETRHLRAANRWAESLSILGPDTSQTDQSSQSPRSRRLTAVDTPFNVEDSGRGSRSQTRGSDVTHSAAGSAHQSRGGAGSDSARTAERGSNVPAGRFAGSSRRGGESAPRGEGHEHEDLLEVLRARRGQRLGADAEADDRLALMLNRPDPQDRGGADGFGADAAREDGDEHSTVPLPRLRPVADDHASRKTVPDGSVPQDGELHPGDDRSARDAESSESEDAPAAPGEAAAEEGVDAWGFAYDQTQRSPAADSEVDDPSADAERPGASGQEAQPDEEAASVKPRRKPAPRRANMPKWDDILFGSKND
ncbi:septation protein SepH [Nesterenkonia sp. Act20]|uniref:septation protein SepH n=1 Tax=Nesterenkonia sp. Act20 TaxID=1483432 RepID=UPI001C47EDBB|nr:septation protein SepH [Nesterenkonia sp. Act20]